MVSVFVIFHLGVDMPHKRSLLGKISQQEREQDFEAIKIQRKAAWQYIKETEFRDRLIGETVCRTDINSITTDSSNFLIRLYLFIIFLQWSSG